MIDGTEGQASLGVCGTQISRSGHVVHRRGRDGLIVDFVHDLGQAGMVGHVEEVLGHTLETLLAVPGHVLDGGQRAVGEEEEVQPAVTDEDVVGALDD